MTLASSSGQLIGRAEFERMQAAAAEGVRLERMDGYVYARPAPVFLTSGWLLV
jgi:hypothetical protein